MLKDLYKFDSNGKIINTDVLKEAVVRIGKTHNIILNLDEPKTIQDKLVNILGAYESYKNNQLVTKCADKYLLHEY